jgi:hypothetical protein
MNRAFEGCILWELETTNRTKYDRIQFAYQTISHALLLSYLIFIHRLLLAVM